MTCTTGQPARLQQFSRRRRLVDAGHDQRRRALRAEHLQQPLFLEAGIMGVAELDAERAVRQAVIDAAHHFGKDVVGERRHQHAEHLGARRGQRPRIRVRHIAEFVDGGLDLAAQILRDALRLAQGARHGDGADAGLARDIGNGRAAAATARARLDQGLAPAPRLRQSAAAKRCSASLPLSPCRSGLLPHPLAVWRRAASRHCQANWREVLARWSRFKPSP